MSTNATAPKELKNFYQIKEVAELENKSIRWINKLILDGRIEGAERAGGIGPWIIPKPYKILPPKPSKSAEAIEFMKKHPTVKAIEAARIFGIDRSALNKYEERKKAKKS